MDDITKECIKAYSELKHLKLTGERVGIPWQKVYIKLKKAGIKVTGDKQRYGSIADKLAARAERLFSKSVPFAIDNNLSEFQSTIDFTIDGISVDVKAANLKGVYETPKTKKKAAAKWSFCISKQNDIADFFVMYALEDGGVKHVFVVPSEIACQKSTISIPLSLESKWADYEVKESDLFEFFDSLR